MNEVNIWLEEFYNLDPNVKQEDQTAKKKENTLSLSVELLSMDMNNMNFYKELTNEQKKEISLWVLMRYMSSSQNFSEHHLMMVNDLVNCHYNVLIKHPELQWKLLALCGLGKKQFHPWIPPPKGVKKNKIEEIILEHYPLLRDDELEMFLTMNTQKDLELFLKENGYDDKTIKDLFKESVKRK